MWFQLLSRVHDTQTVLWVAMTCWLGFWVGVAALPSTKTRHVDASRIVAIVMTTTLSLGSAVVLWSWPDASPNRLLACALGYFIWDLLVCLLYPREMGLDMLAHAIACTAAYTLALEPFLPYECVALLLFELSSPFLQAFQLARAYGLGVRLQVYTMMAFAGVFFLVRILWGTYFIAFYVLPAILAQNHGPALTAWACACLVGACALNLRWFWRIVGMARGR